MERASADIFGRVFVINYTPLSYLTFLNKFEGMEQL